MTDHAKELEELALTVFGSAADALLLRAATELRSLRSEKTRLITELIEARNDIESWAAYATEYFQEKHDLPGNLKRIDDFLKGIKE